MCSFIGTHFFISERKLAHGRLLVIILFTVFTVNLYFVSCDNNNSSTDEAISSQTPTLSPEEKLIDYLIEHGNSRYSGIYYITDYDYNRSNTYTYFLFFDEDENEIYFSRFTGDNLITSPHSLRGFTQHIEIPLDFNSSYSHASYSYDSTIMYVVEENINKNKFSKSNDTIEDIEVIGNFSLGNSMAKDMFKSSVSDLLSYINDELKNLDIGISLSDLGFVNY